jgi:hypothetical protein
VTQTVADEPTAAVVKRQLRPKQKNDPRYVAAARELRDRYLDEVNSGRFLLSGNEKYDVSRAIAGPPQAATLPLLPAA